MSKKAMGTVPLVEDNCGDARLLREKSGESIQPKTSLPFGEIVAVEASSPWIHPVRAVVPPAPFIPVAKAKSSQNPIPS